MPYFRGIHWVWVAVFLISLGPQVRAQSSGPRHYTPSGKYGLVVSPHQIQVFGPPKRLYTQLTWNANWQPWWQVSSDERTLILESRSSAPSSETSLRHYYIFELPTLKLLQQLTLKSALPVFVDVDAQQKYLAGLGVFESRQRGDYDRADLGMWNLATGQELWRVPAYRFRNTSGHPPDFKVRFDPRGRHLAVGMDWDMGATPPVRAKLKIWDLWTQQWQYWLNGNRQFHYASQSPYLVFAQGPEVGTQHWRIKRWNLAANRLRTVSVPMNPVFNEVFVSPDGQYLAWTQFKNAADELVLWSISPSYQVKKWRFDAPLVHAAFSESTREIQCIFGGARPTLKTYAY